MKSSRVAATFNARTSLPEGVLVGERAAPELHVMSWNIRRKVWHRLPRTPDRWSVRAPRLRALLQVERPVLLGVQEALREQTQFIEDALGAGYRSIGYGRGAKLTGEACPMFYDDSRLELLSWTQQALSDRPSEPGSTSWGNLIPRLVVIATFRERMSNGCFQAINTHFDHISVRSRKRSAEAISRYVFTHELPSIVMGDFNARAGSLPLNELLTRGTLADAWEVAQKRLSKPWDTFASYRPPRLDRSRIDWILTSADIRVLAAGINAWHYGGGWGSDHLPVQAVVQLPQRRRCEQALLTP